MEASLIFKIVAIGLLVMILLSLAAGMLFLVRDQGKSPRTRNALTVRIILSVALFLLLLIGYKAGWIRPHGVAPAPSADTGLTLDDQNQ